MTSAADATQDHARDHDPGDGLEPGPTNSLTDVGGLRVGHATRDEPGWLTGTSVVLAPEGGATCGVDVRGGGPGTRETDLLDPRNLVDRVDAVVIGGGSAMGLGAADGVARELLAAGVGWPMGPPGQVVPIVPAAILFDLGRGGVWGHHPGADDGAAAYRDAVQRGAGSAIEQGCVGAGTGAKAGGLKGGIGSASVVLPGGVTVAAMVACNAVGSAVDPVSGELYAVRSGVGLPGDWDDVRAPDEGDLERSREVAAALPERVAGMPALATTIGVIATDATLTKAQCQKTAGVGHDGMARALKPIHTMFDGDTLFCLATGQRPAPDPFALVMLMEAAADCVTRAVGRAMLAATSVDRTAGGGVAFRSWRDAFPSGVR